MCRVHKDPFDKLTFKLFTRSRRDLQESDLLKTKNHKSSVILTRAPEGPLKGALLKHFFPKCFGIFRVQVRFSIKNHVHWLQNRVFWAPRHKTMQNHYEITSTSEFWTRNMRNCTKSLVSGIWFLSPEAGGTLRRQLGEPGRAVHTTCPLRCCIRTL